MTNSRPSDSDVAIVPLARTAALAVQCIRACMGAGAHNCVSETPMSHTDTSIDEYQQVAADLEYWLAIEAERGVPELALCWLLSHYASVIETQGFIPRSWADPRWPDHP